MRFVNRLLYYRPHWLIWIFRLALTFNIVLPGLTFPSHIYPLDVLMLAALAYWLDLGKMTIVAVALLLLATCLNINHYLYPHYE